MDLFSSCNTPNISSVWLLIPSDHSLISATLLLWAANAFSEAVACVASLNIAYPNAVTPATANTYGFARAAFPAANIATACFLKAPVSNAVAVVCWIVANRLRADDFTYECWATWTNRIAVLYERKAPAAFFTNDSRFDIVPSISLFSNASLKALAISETSFRIFSPKGRK